MTPKNPHKIPSVFPFEDNLLSFKQVFFVLYRQLFLSTKYAVGNCTGQIKNKVYFEDIVTLLGGQWAAQKFIQLDKKQFEFQCFGSACILLYVDPDPTIFPMRIRMQNRPRILDFINFISIVNTIGIN